MSGCGAETHRGSAEFKGVCNIYNIYGEEDHLLGRLHPILYTICGYCVVASYQERRGQLQSWARRMR